MMDRIVTLVDMDCFYCQVEARLNPSLNGKPLAVVQYNKWKGGGIIAVNYEARDFGVTRSMRGDEARKKCPDIVLVHVPEVRGKADLTKYREAGREVVDVFCQFSDCVQRASVDEAYIDVTRAVEQRINSLDRVQSSQLAATFVVGFSDIDSNDEEARHQGLTAWLESVYEMQDQAQLRLAVAGIIVEEMRAAVFQQTGFRCSAGIAHNKILGKLACGLHKPNRQTVLPQAGVTELYKTLPIRKVRNLGGKFGSVVVEQLGCKVMADLLRFTESQLQQKFDEKTGTWLYNITRGIDHDPVTQRLVSKSVGCCKKFPGRQALATRTDVKFWLSELSAEVAERLTKDLEENKRQAKLLTVSYHQDIDSRGEMSSSRSGPLTSYDPQRIAADAFELVKKSNTGSASGSDLWYPPLKFLGLSAGKFVDGGEAQNSTIHDFFKAAKKGTEVNKEGHENVMDLNKVANENINDTNILNIRQEHKHGHSKSLADHKNRCEADSTRFMVNDASETSSTSNSFFMKYLKQHNAKKSAELFSGKVSIDKPINNANSDDDMFESPTDKEKMKEEKLNLNSGTKVTKLNLGPSTSVIKTEPDENASELWVSVRELFPDLSKVDYGVVALLPVPLQKRLQAQIEKAKQDPSIRNRHYFNSPMTSDDSDLIEADQQRGTEVVHVERDTCNERNIMNPSHQFDDQYDGNLLSKSRCVLQHTVEEDSDLVEIYDDVAVHLEAGQKYLSASRVSMSNRDEGLVVSEKDASHTHVTGGAEGSDPETSQCVVTEMCPQCGKDILLCEYLEHLDFHAAEKLHKELNKEVEQVRTVVKASTPHKNPSLELPTRRKRGRSSKKLSVTDRDKKMRSITAYFTAK